MISVVVALFLVSPATDLEQAATNAIDARDFRAAAMAWERLARLPRAEDPKDREVTVYRAARAWARVDVCEGLALLKWWFTEGQPVDPEFVAQYRKMRAKKQAGGLRCAKSGVTAPSPSGHVLAEQNERALEAEASNAVVAPPRPRIFRPVASPSASIDSPPQKDRDPLKVAGGVLLAAAGIGTGVLVGQGVEFARVYQKYAHGPTHDEKLYQQAKNLERWMIGTGVATVATLAAGVTSLVVAKHRKLKLQPTLGGITLRGRF